MNPVRLNGNSLTLEELRDIVVDRRPVMLEAGAREKVRAARAVVDRLVAENRVAYAINTGVGKLSDVHIPPEQNRQLQVNLIRSNCAGVGEPLSVDETRAMMLLRANSLSKGYSGVRTEVIDLICEMLNRGIHPIVPSQGSVGASGDLAPLAHLALAMIGEGDVIFENARMLKRRRNEESAGRAAGPRSQGSYLSHQWHPGNACGRHAVSFGGGEPGRHGGHPGCHDTRRAPWH